MLAEIDGGTLVGHGGNNDEYRAFAGFIRKRRRSGDPDQWGQRSSRDGRDHHAALIGARRCHMVGVLTYDGSTAAVDTSGSTGEPCGEKSVSQVYRDTDDLAFGARRGAVRWALNWSCLV